RLDTQRLLRTAPTIGLRAGMSYHIELAFMDRRVSFGLNGKEPFQAVDLEVVRDRGDVVRPIRVGARGVDALFRNVRLYRDIHYTGAGRHGVGEPVRLGAGQYFVLGDNSPNSDDSRFWSDDGGRPRLVPGASFLGKPFLLHLPTGLRDGPDGRPEPGVDWGRIRWLH